MADIKIDFSNVHECALDLSAAGNDMHTTMLDALSAVQRAGAQLSGQLQSQAMALYTAIQNSDAQMTGDIAKASRILDEMASMLQSADAQAARGFGG
jgi:hypothetical protein